MLVSIHMTDATLKMPAWGLGEEFAPPPDPIQLIMFLPGIKTTYYLILLKRVLLEVRMLITLSARKYLLSVEDF